MVLLTSIHLKKVKYNENFSDLRLINVSFEYFT